MKLFKIAKRKEVLAFVKAWNSLKTGVAKISTMKLKEHVCKVEIITKKCIKLKKAQKAEISLKVCRKKQRKQQKFAGKKPYKALSLKKHKKVKLVEK